MSSTTSGTTPKKGKVADPGLVGVAPGNGRNQDAAGFGLPPGIDDGTSVAADDFMIPHPGFRVDRFAHGAQQAKRTQIVLSGHSVPHFMNARMAVGAVYRM